MTLFLEAGGKCLPKHHQFLHALDRIKTLGNPKFYSTYFDETVNQWLARLAKRAHRCTFAGTVYIRFKKMTGLA